MAELTSQERLQPSLLDRLTDDEPEQSQESRDQRVLSIRRLRESVRRDLAWLFNTTNLSVVQDMSPFPEVENSVLNYGIPELSGLAIASLPTVELERRIRQAILTYEPRILPHTLDIHIITDRQSMTQQALAFEITGDLWAQPIPEQLYLKTEIDLELGDFKVTEFSGRG